MYNFEKIAQKDYSQYESLLDFCPINSKISYVLKRRLNNFLCNKLTNRNLFVAKKEEKIIGSFLMTEEEYFFNGEVINSGYLGMLRIFKNSKHNFSLLKKGYEKLIDLKNNKTKFFYTVISSDNEEGKRLLEANLKFIPKYNYVNNITTFCFSNKNKKSSSIVEEIKIEEFILNYNALAKKFDLALVLKKECFYNVNVKFFKYMKNGTLCSVFALLNVSDESNIYAKHYHKWLNFSLPLLNKLLYLFGYPKLPKEGDFLSNTFLSFFVYKNLIENDFLVIFNEVQSLIETDNFSFSAFNNTEIYNVINKNYKTLKMESCYYTVFDKIELKNPIVEGVLL